MAQFECEPETVNQKLPSASTKSFLFQKQCMTNKSQNAMKLAENNNTETYQRFQQCLKAQKGENSSKLDPLKQIE